MADSTQPSEQDKDALRKAKRREYAKRYYQKNKKRISEKHKAWVAANKDRHKALCQANRKANKKKDRDRQTKWRSENPEKVLASQKRYREKNKAALKNRRDNNREKARAATRAHYHRNKGQYRTRRQEYRKENKRKLQAAASAYYENNRDKVLEKHKQYRQSNLESTRKRNREYQKQKWQEDFGYWLKKNVARRMRDALSEQAARKHGRTIKLIGCSAAQLALHLESRFLPGMSWANYGYRGWHIDHIIPLAKFNLDDPDQQAAAFHYSNLQPLWAKDNLAKRDKVSGQQAFGFAYAAKIADAASAKPKKRQRHGRKHGSD